MGVKGLWQLLLPTGRRISIETLTGQTLAIDASIWLTQFIKAHRDPENGKVHYAAHIIGFFRRICKLLFHGIKPIFVFDGDTPEIKLREIRSRRERRDKIHSFASSDDKDGIKRLAKRLLVQNLKKRKELDIAVGARKNNNDDSAIDNNNDNHGSLAAGFILPYDTSNVESENPKIGKEQQQNQKYENDNNSNECDIDKIISETKDYIDKNLIEIKSQQPEQNDWDNAYYDGGVNDNDSESNESVEIPEDEKDLSKEVLSSLPTKTRIDVIEKAKRQQRMQSRKEFMSVAANPDSYSQCQLRNFLKSASFAKKINEVGQIVSKQGEFGINGEKIASDASRRFIFTKDIDIDNEQQVESNEDDIEKHVTLVRSGASPVTKRRRLMKVSNVSNDDGQEEENDDELFRTDTVHSHGHNSTKAWFNEHDDCDDDNSLVDSDNGGGFIKFNEKNDKLSNDTQNIIIKNNNMLEIVDSSDDCSDEMEGGFMPPEDSQQQHNSGIRPEKDTVIEINSNDSSDEGGGFIHAEDIQDSCHKGSSCKKDAVIDINSDDSSDEGEGFIHAEDMQALCFKNTSCKTVKVCEINGDEGTKSENQERFVRSNDDRHNLSMFLDVELNQTNDKAERNVKDRIERSSRLDEHIKSLEDSDKDIEWEDCEAKSYHEVACATEISQDNKIKATQSDDTLQSCDDGGPGEEDVAWEDCEVESSDDQKNGETSTDSNVCNETHIDVGLRVSNCKINGYHHTKIGISQHDEDIPSATQDVHSLNGSKDDVEWEDCDQEDVSPHDYQIMNNKDATNDNFVPIIDQMNNANTLALKRAQTTALTLTDWAGRAVQRAISAHLNEIGQSQSKDEEENDDDDSYDESGLNPSSGSDKQSQPRESETINNQKDNNNISSNDIFDTSLGTLQEIEMNMREEEKKRERDMETVTDDMIEEVMQLLQLFGIPYLKAPAEAEAQCVELEKLGLVDGVITEDSDAIVFGSKSVYKNIFDDRKYVEVYTRDSAEKLGLGYNEKVALAMLLGGDYTEGVKGVGIVNGMEILQAFPMNNGVKDGLLAFRKWLDGTDFSDTMLENKKNGRNNGLSTTQQQLFHDKHKSARLRWVLPPDFPSDKVLKAYTHPVVDNSTQKFTFGIPDDKNIRLFCRYKMGWDNPEIDRHLCPVLIKMQTRDKTQQMTMDRFLMRLEDNHIISHQIKSKRLREVLESTTTKDEDQEK